MLSGDIDKKRYEEIFSCFLLQVIKQFALLCTIDNIKKIRYTDIDRLDRVNSLELRARLAVSFLHFPDCRIRVDKSAYLV